MITYAVMMGCNYPPFQKGEVWVHSDNINLDCVEVLKLVREVHGLRDFTYLGHRVL